jgi:hypothetical protein
VWLLLRRGYTANVAVTNPDHLIRTVRRGLRKIQYRQALLDGCLAGTGLAVRLRDLDRLIASLRKGVSWKDRQ